ncbi:MAG: FAD:protein FMN transferase, partial [Ruminococcus sp.]|nr:FAD:protein FMN transferase [Ruminococcus sp.]
HIFDLNTGRPSETDLTSVTIICDSGIKSDFLSTLIYLGGTARLGEYLDDETLKIVAVTENREIYLSGGIDFELNEDSSYTIKEADNE